MSSDRSTVETLLGGRTTAIAKIVLQFSTADTVQFELQSNTGFSRNQEYQKRHLNVTAAAGVVAMELFC